MGKDHENELGLRKIPASEIIDKIQKGESVDYDHVLIKSDLDINKFYSAKEKRVVDSPIVITKSLIKGKLNLEETIFEQQINFESSQFGRNASFKGTTFNDEASFRETTFNRDAHFSETTFNRDAHFSETTFNRDAHFSKITFNGEAYFSETTFKKDAHFSETTFNGEAYFIGTTFDRDAFFDSARFSKAAFFSRAKFMRFFFFTRAMFSRDAYFDSARFIDTGTFDRVKFSRRAYFDSAMFSEDVNFEDASLTEGIEGLDSGQSGRLIGLRDAYYKKAVQRSIGFKANRKWNITELQLFITSISDIYNIFLIKKISEKKDINFHEMLEGGIERFTEESQMLKIYKIEMGSPGGFSFLGLPEIIEQIRKTLIWWFHERNLNEFERAEKCLELVKKYLELRNLDNESECIDDLIKKFCAGVKIFKELESKGKLEKVTENFDYVPTKYNGVEEIKIAWDDTED